jgi:allantoinase
MVGGRFAQAALAIVLAVAAHVLLVGHTQQGVAPAAQQAHVVVTPQAGVPLAAQAVGFASSLFSWAQRAVQAEPPELPHPQATRPPPPLDAPPAARSEPRRAPEPVELPPQAAVPEPPAASPAAKVAVAPAASAASCSLQPPSATLTLFSTRVVTPTGVVSAAVEVRGGVITSVTPREDAPLGSLDYGNAVLSPGLVDVHVHLNEPGRTDWEGFDTGTRAAAAGGVTTLVDMPLNCAPTTVSAELLAHKLEAARGKLYVDVAFWGGLVPSNAANLTALEALLDAGVVGLKAFMSPSGIDDFEHTTPAHLAAALPSLAARGRMPLMVHAELPPAVVPDVPASDDPRSYDTYLRTRPREWEEKAITELCALATADGAPIHIAHLSDAGSLALIGAARAAGKAITVETAPHYLTFAAERIADGDTRFKCAPPVREEANRAALWAALLAGEIDIVSSDHSPAPPALKLEEEGHFLRAWGGISSLQFGLPATWNEGRMRGMTLEALARVWSSAPAALIGLEHSKGRIAVGADADFVVWSPDAPVVLDERHKVFHRHGVHPYAGRTLHGRVLATFVRGAQVFDAATGEHAPAPCGKPLLRARAPPVVARTEHAEVRREHAEVEVPPT